MFKKQMNFQKILFTALLALGAVVFVYGIGLSTDLYGLYQAKSVGGVTGYKIFDNIQTYNHWLVIISIALILVCCIPFVFSSNTRRKYYKGNVIGTYVQAAAFVGTGVFILIETIKYRAEYLKVDFVEFKELCEEMGFAYSDSTFFFDAGFVVAVLLFIGAGLLIYNLMWKQKIVKKEDEILAGGAK